MSYNKYVPVFFLFGYHCPFSLCLVIRVILQLNGIGCWGLLPYDFPLVVSHTVFILPFQLWCMHGGGVRI